MQHLFIEIFNKFTRVESWTRSPKHRMPVRDSEAAVGDDNDHSWVQCDACNKWRAITESTLAQIQVASLSCQAPCHRQFCERSAYYRVHARCHVVVLALF